MRVGAHLVNFGFRAGTEAIAPTLIEVGRAVEEAGLDNLSVMDHYFQMDGAGLGDATAPMLEGYTVLGFLAAHTETVELQTLVTGVTYRHPGLLAKIVTTLDVLSGGRAMLGLGAAWYEREHAGLGVPFPPLSERFERLEETLQIILQMWSDNDGPYDGEHYRLTETLCSPKPLRRPHPPIMIGGSGEQKTLRLVARYADACNFFARPDVGPDAVRAKLDILARHCEDAGTDAEHIRKTILWTAPLDPASAGEAHAFNEQMKRYADVGIAEVRITLPGDPIAFIQHLGRQVVPALSRL